MKSLHSPKLYSLVVLTIAISLTFTSCESEKEDPNKEEWTVMFNGSNLDGWVPKFTGYELGENYHNRFIVKDSLLSVRYSVKDTFQGDFGHLYYKKKFSHYRLKARYRFVGEQMAGGPGWAVRNNGLMLHCQDPKTLGIQQDFPISLELQLLGGDGEHARSTANLCTPGTNVVMQDSLFTPSLC